MTNSTKTENKFPIRQGTEFGLTIDYGDPEQFFSATGSFWEIASSAALSYANVHRQNEVPSFKNLGKKIFPKPTNYTLYEISDGNAQIKPSPLEETDKIMAIDAAEKYVSDALWLMINTGLITENEIQKLAQFPGLITTDQLNDRVKLSR